MTEHGTAPQGYSDDPIWTIYETGGGALRVGEFVGRMPDGRMRLLTDPGGSVPFTCVKESCTLMPQEVCDRHNRLLWEAQRLRRRDEARRPSGGVLMRLKHILTGHPPGMVWDDSPASIRCECGMRHGLGDFP